MQYEVEQKFSVSDAQLLHTRLEALDICWGETVRQEDAYFNHPSQDRDFAKTDEALRVRLDGDQAMFTYKGPRVDSVTKTRQELELQVANPGDSGESMKQFLQTLGFIYVHSVVKQRRKGKLVFQDQTVEVALDEVEGLGLFIEFEIVTGEEELKAATDLLVRLSESLSLGDGITVGYLDLLLR